ncbi:hypothetical protein JMY07_30265 (plasmid) [Burkholderia thailandensis]|uniref:hypothetical protein n=1 Tax=Burkholderia thailandensis TaxID=57975 RepID=UPI00192D5646|nr:hypothetical protein [Burkholderia thailandensis]QRA15191.1 hypothetical protein JMY07_30265 [Burkholderia thailandensis]
MARLPYRMNGVTFVLTVAQRAHGGMRRSVGRTQHVHAPLALGSLHESADRLETVGRKLGDGATPHQETVGRPGIGVRAALEDKHAVVKQPTPNRLTASRRRPESARLPGQIRKRRIELALRVGLEHAREQRRVSRGVDRIAFERFAQHTPEPGG